MARPAFKIARGICPSCNGRRMAQTAAHLVDHVELLDRLADLVPPPRKHRHRYHGVFAPNHPLRSRVTAMAIGNAGKAAAATSSSPQNDGAANQATHGADGSTRSHDTSRIAWAKLLAKIAEEFPLVCPVCGGDIRLIAFRLLSECETIHGLRTLGSTPAAADLMSATRR